MYNNLMDTIGFVSKYDPEVGQAMDKELARQKRNLELIASENIVSPEVMAAMGSVLTNKYAEGYPGKRYYGGCECVDIVENIAIERAKKLFGAEYANVQAHSGAQANTAVYFALLEPGDTVMGMSLAHGGHLTHGSPVNLSGKYFNFISYGLGDDERIDYDKIEELAKENLAALEKGSENLAAHIDNLHKFGVPVVVAINHFYADTDKEIEFIEKFCKQKGADFAVTKCFAEGGAGSIDLANKVIKACEKENNFRFLYDINMPIYEKIETIAKEIYGADGVEYTKEAKKSIDEFIKLGCDNMPVCMAKTQYSLSDNPALLGRPHGFKITVSSASLSNGAGFLVCQTGSVMTMPGLSKSPAAYKIDIDENGNTVGLF